jgi:release factor glutamine methyltransferase
VNAAALASVGALLEQARALGVDRLDAQWLLGHVLGRSRAWLVANGEALPDATQHAAIAELLQRRAAGVPLAYLVGMTGFHGLVLRVTPDVLIPRPETELLVDWAVEMLRGEGAAVAAPSVVDLGCGSGSIAVALKHAVPHATVLATDLSRAALDVARGNASRLGLDVGFAESDWWRGLAGRRFHLAVSNPPYIAGGDPHLPALRHEPALALTPGGDGLDALRAIVANAAAHLHPDGWLLVEHGCDQADAVRALLRTAGFDAVATRDDLARLPRCTGGRRAAVEIAAATGIR